MKKGSFLMIFVFSLLTVIPANAFAQIPPPARIGGTVTVDGVQLTQDTDTGDTFTVTKQGGTPYNPSAEDTDGLNSFDWYTIDIPIYDANNQAGGAHPGENAVFHVFLDGNELSVVSPANGQITVGDSGSTTQINITAQTTTPCKAANIEATPKTLKLRKEENGDVTVTVTCSNGFPVADETVTSKIKSGKKRISASPQDANTDANGKAVFTITATKKTGNENVEFTVKDLKKKAKVKVKVKK